MSIDTLENPTTEEKDPTQLKQEVAEYVLNPEGKSPTEVLGRVNWALSVFSKPEDSVEKKEKIVNDVLIGIAAQKVSQALGPEQLKRVFISANFTDIETIETEEIIKEINKKSLELLSKEVLSMELAADDLKAVNVAKLTGSANRRKTIERFVGKIERDKNTSPELNRAGQIYDITAFPDQLLLDTSLDSTKNNKNVVGFIEVTALTPKQISDITEKQQIMKTEGKPLKSSVTATDENGNETRLGPELHKEILMVDLIREHFGLRRIGAEQKIMIRVPSYSPDINLPTKEYKKELTQYDQMLDEYGRTLELCGYKNAIYEMPYSVEEFQELGRLLLKGAINRYDPDMLTLTEERIALLRKVAADPEK